MKKEYKYPQMQVEEIELLASICDPTVKDNGEPGYDPFGGGAPARTLYV